MSVAREPFLTFEEYLELEAASPVRHEFVGGAMYAMTGTTKRHNLVSIALVSALGPSARDAGCSVYMADVKLRVGESAYYPDVMVVCEGSEHELYDEHPCLVVEVTSPSSERTDRREKRAAYTSIPSLRAYLIVDPSWPRVEAHQRVDGQWTVAHYGPGDQIALDCPDLVLDLDSLYPDDWRS